MRCEHKTSDIWQPCSTPMPVLPDTTNFYGCKEINTFRAPTTPSPPTWAMWAAGGRMARHGIMTSCEEAASKRMMTMTADTAKAKFIIFRLS